MSVLMLHLSVGRITGPAPHPTGLFLSLRPGLGGDGRGSDRIGREGILAGYSKHRDHAQIDCIETFHGALLLH
jgi:hypothetical protein